MKTLSRSQDPNRASIPFDKEWNGFVMGEGAGVLLLEDLDHALARVPNVGRKADLYTALSNSLGFGGHNGSILFQK